MTKRPERTQSDTEVTPEGVCSRPLLGRDELADLLRTSRETVSRMRSDGLLPEPTYVNRSPRWSRDEVLAWVKDGKADARRGA